jgi:tetratricopeptide (TPR) repeat protein
VPKTAWAAAILLCGAFAIRTFLRNFDWHDELRLGRASVAAAPGSFKTHQLLASAELNARPPDVENAMKEAESILKILDPLPTDLLSARPYDVVGQAFRQKGDSLAPRGKNPDPDSPSGLWYRKALAVLLRGDEIDRAERERIRTKNLASGRFAFSAGWVNLYLELGRVYRRLGEPQKAMDAFADGRLRSPDDEFSEDMSLTRLGMGDPLQAAVPLMEGLVLNPNSTRLASDLVELYRQKAPDSCAINKAANSINLECPLVHDQLCAASRNIAASYAANGRRTKAAETVRTALQSLACPAQLFR